MSTGKCEFAIIGKGNQAIAWAHNLSASGHPFKIGVRENQTQELPYPTFKLGPDLKEYSTLALLIPDDQHLSFLKEHSQHIKIGTNLLYAHGYSVTYEKLQELYPEFNHILFAPKSIGDQIIVNYLKKKKTAVFCSLEYSREDKRTELEELAKQLGFFISSYGDFREEVIADLFSEQTLLCGLYPYMIHHAFETLRKKGINPELSFLECWHESKLIMETLIEKGPEQFFKLISPNALYGAHHASQVLFDDSFLNKIEKLYTNIESGEFQESIKGKNYQETANEVTNFWKQSPLQKTFEQFKDQLYQ